MTSNSTPKGMEMMSPMPKSWSPRMLQMSWPAPDPETAAILARSVADLLRGASVAWEGLPGWETRFHVLCRKQSSGARVAALVWPEPSTDRP